MKRTLLPIAMAVFGCLILAPQSLAADQPNMRAAIDLLHQAEKSDAPLALMQKAKTHLQHAAKNKGGSRVEAIKILNDAIELAKAGEKDKAIQKLSRVISEIHSGMDKAN